MFTAQSIQNLRDVVADAEDVFDMVIEIDDQHIVDYYASRLNGAIGALVYILAPGLDINDDYEGDVQVGDIYVVSGISYGFIYGLTEGEGLVLDTDVFEINGIDPGNVRVVSGSYGNGTGSYVQAKDRAGTTKFVMYGVLYGDVNGDSRIDGTDKTYIMAYAINAANSGNLDPSYYGGSFNKAADVDGDGSITPSDAAAINLVVNYEAEISQSSDVTGSRVVPLNNG